LHGVSVQELREAGERLVDVDISVGLAVRQGRPCSAIAAMSADPRTNRVILVGDDTPASRAGLRHDDIVLKPDVWRFAHVEGALLHVLVLREGGTLTLPMLVGRICITR